MKNNRKTSPLRPLAEQIAGLQADEQNIKSQLPGLRKQYIERKIESILPVLEEQYPQLLSLMKTVQGLIESAGETERDERKEKAYREYCEAFKKLSSGESGISAGDGVPLKSSTWQDLLGLSNETMLVLYEIGYGYYETEHFPEAKSIFETLILLNGTVSDYRTAFGFTERKLGEDERALEAFSMGSILDPENPVPRYRYAETALDLGRVKEAEGEIEALSKIAEKNPTLHFLKNDLDNLKKRISLAHRTS